LAVARTGGSWFSYRVRSPLPSVRRWLPPLLWMLLIFGASADPFSGQRTSRILEPLLRWLLPWLSEPAVQLGVLLLRKCAHVGEYAVLAALLWCALRESAADDPRRWDWPVAGRVMLVVVLYAASDEFHQRFVPSRQATLQDVLVDALGGLVGLAAVWAARKCRRRAAAPGPDRTG